MRWAQAAQAQAAQEAQKAQDTVIGRGLDSEPPQALPSPSRRRRRRASCARCNSLACRQSAVAALSTLPSPASLLCRSPCIITHHSPCRLVSSRVLSYPVLSCPPCPLAVFRCRRPSPRERCYNTLLHPLLVLVLLNWFEAPRLAPGPPPPSLLGLQPGPASTSSRTGPETSRWHSGLATAMKAA